MNRHFRPQIQNGQVTKRTTVTYTANYASKKPSQLSLPMAPVTPAWSGPSVEVGALAQRGLSLLALDEPLRSSKTVAKEKTASRPYALVGLLFCGALLAGGFMFSLRDHFIAHAFGREEVKMKSQTDHVNTERQHIKAQVDRAASPQEIDRAAREHSGLAPLEFDQKKAITGAKKIATTEKAKKPAAPQPSARSAGN
ncbi:MAG: hypothetical protein JST84_01540 [Acidobacteria bacterium]|nr:hypothetical protein [Acidobacteriota bacterium]